MTQVLPALYSLQDTASSSKRCYSQTSFSQPIRKFKYCSGPPTGRLFCRPSTETVISKRGIVRWHLVLYVKHSNQDQRSDFKMDYYYGEKKKNLGKKAQERALGFARRLVKPVPKRIRGLIQSKILRGKANKKGLHSKFLQLPMELQLMIAGDVLKAPQSIRIKAKGDEPSSVKAVIIVGDKTYKVDLRLLMVCKHFYINFKPEFPKVNTFEFATAEAMKSFAESFGPVSYRSLTFRGSVAMDLEESSILGAIALSPSVPEELGALKEISLRFLLLPVSSPRAADQESDRKSAAESLAKNLCQVASRLQLLQSIALKIDVFPGVDGILLSQLEQESALKDARKFSSTFSEAFATSQAERIETSQQDRSFNVNLEFVRHERPRFPCLLLTLLS